MFYFKIEFELLRKSEIDELHYSSYNVTLF